MKTRLKKLCPKCDGTGKGLLSYLCPKCKGNGTVPITILDLTK